MNKNKSSNYFIVLLIAVVLVVIFYLFLNSNDIPQGVPADYYEKMDVLVENNIAIYVYSDTIDFSDGYEYIEVENESDVGFSPNYKNVLVIDMIKYNRSQFISVEKMFSLYNNRTTLIIVNYNFTDSTLLNEFIDITLRDSDLIVFTYNSNYNQVSGSVDGEFLSEDMLMYAIINEIYHGLILSD